MDIEGTEDMRISSMGFASDGCFHIRLELAQGVAPELGEDDGVSGLYISLSDSHWDSAYRLYQERLVEGGIDILFPLLKAENLEGIQSREAGIFGGYTRPGTDIEGSWSTEFELDYYPSAVLDWTGELDGWQVERMTVSPLSVTMKSNASGGLDIPLYAVKKDGSTVAAQLGRSGYNNVGAMRREKEEKWEAYATWKFEEPVEVEDLVSLRLGDAVIPVN